MRAASRLALMFAACASLCASGAPASAADEAGGASVVVAKAVNACFSDLVRVTGFVVARREAVVNVDSEGSKVTELLVREGETVTDSQELARLTAPPMPPQSGARPGPVTLRAPAPGMIVQVMTIVGAPASPQAPPMFKIAVNGELELDVEVPSVHMLKLNPGASARIIRDDMPDVVGRVRLVSPVIDRTTQLGKVRLTLPRESTLKPGMFARASIDARRSCGVAIPRSSVDHLTIQVVRGNTVETRKVRTGLVSDNSIEILDGVSVGELVVADAGSSLHDGDKVKPTFVDDLDRPRGR